MEVLIMLHFALLHLKNGTNTHYTYLKNIIYLFKTEGHKTFFVLGWPTTAVRLQKL